MAMGKRKSRQESLFIATDQLAQSPGHPFYTRLNALLDEFGFDRWVERRCARYYEQEEKRGQPSILSQGCSGVSTRIPEHPPERSSANHLPDIP